MNNNVVINGFSIPEALIAAIESGAWNNSYKVDVWHKCFLEKHVKCPKLYTLKEITILNKQWLNAESIPYYLGRVNDFNFPGTIDPRKSIVIAELDYEIPIVLDYRDTIPSVAYLAEILQNGQIFYVWQKVTSSIEEFLYKMGIW